MQRTKPPFRADHVGSLLRPTALKQARERCAKGEITAAALKEIEDREIERVIKKQEEVGLQSATDGEFRRSWWHLDFLWGLDGVERTVMDTGIAFAGVTTRNEGVRVTGIPADMTVTMHLCRGNYKSTFMGSGGYEAEREVLFDKINVHGYFMEYDTERAGGFEPLRLLPKGKLVVLGLVTTKSGKLESKDELKRRIDEAAKYTPLEQLCLSGQCGFASTEEGNLLSEDEQWAKLARIVGVADEVWGRT